MSSTCDSLPICEQNYDETICAFKSTRRAGARKVDRIHEDFGKFWRELVVTGKETIIFQDDIDDKPQITELLEVNVLQN